MDLPPITGASPESLATQARRSNPALLAQMAFTLATILCFATTTQAIAQSGARPNERLMNPELLQRGQRVYMDHCSGCHGTKGDGQGPAAYGLIPKPRDLTTAVFKLRSTPPGTLPTDEDMVRTIKQGVPGTSMNAFNLMPDHDVMALVQYIKTFSEDWRDPDRYYPPVTLPPPPDWFRDPEQRTAHIENGRELFVGNCATCHGDEGRGDGPSSTLLMDMWEQPTRPANLITGRIKSGRSASDLFKAITTGLDGSPMPSFEEALDEGDRWDIVAFLSDLRETHLQQKLANLP